VPDCAEFAETALTVDSPSPIATGLVHDAPTIAIAHVPIAPNHRQTSTGPPVFRLTCTLVI
jgi:hypothetical protein